MPCPTGNSTGSLCVCACAQQPSLFSILPSILLLWTLPNQNIVKCCLILSLCLIFGSKHRQTIRWQKNKIVDVLLHTAPCGNALALVYSIRRTTKIHWKSEQPFASICCKVRTPNMPTCVFACIHPQKEDSARQLKSLPKNSIPNWIQQCLKCGSRPFCLGHKRNLWNSHEVGAERLDIRIRNTILQPEPLQDAVKH